MQCERALNTGCPRADICLGGAKGSVVEPSTKQRLDLAADVLDHDQAPSAYHAALSHPASRIRDVVDVDELVLQFTHGVMIKELARETCD